MRRIGLAALVAVAAVAGWVQATTVETVNVARMVELAERVFRGRCVSVEPAGRVLGLPVLEYTFEVVDGIKGTASGERVVFRQVRPGTGPQGGIPGVPAYRKGEQLLLFLHGESEAGLTSPVGLIQGAFRVQGAAGEERVVNAVGNRNLGAHLSRAEFQQMGLDEAEADGLLQPGSLPLTLLRSAVEKIDRHHRRSREKQIQ